MFLRIQFYLLNYFFLYLQVIILIYCLTFYSILYLTFAFVIIMQI